MHFKFRLFSIYSRFIGIYSTVIWKWSVLLIYHQIEQSGVSPHNALHGLKSSKLDWGLHHSQPSSISWLTSEFSLLSGLSARTEVPQSFDSMLAWLKGRAETIVQWVGTCLTHVQPGLIFHNPIWSPEPTRITEAKVTYEQYRYAPSPHPQKKVTVVIFLRQRHRNL